jgi:hypothetical protein
MSRPIKAAAAATFGLINSIGQLGGLVGNYTIGFLNDRTHSLTASFGVIAVAYVVAGSLILSLASFQFMRPKVKSFAEG